MGVGRQAARRQLRDRGPRPRVQRPPAARDRARFGRGLPREHASLRRAQQSRSSGTGVWTIEQIRDHFEDRAQAARSSSGSTATSPRPVARTGCARSRSSPSGSTANCESEAIRPCSSRWRRCSRVRRRRPPRRGSARSSRTIARPSSPTAGTCWMDTDSSTWRARSSVSAASGPGPGSRLLIGRDESDPLFLQVKEAQPSVLEPYTAPTEFNRQGQRVVEGQRLTQAASDIFLGWLSATRAGRQEARLLRPPALGPEGLGRGRADVSGRDDRLRPGLRRRSSRAPMRAPATGSRSPPTSAAETASTRRSRDFADAYADQNEADFAALKRAAGDGRIAAESEPV